MKSNESEYKQFWDTRYAHSEFAYGTSPNAFFKACVDTLLPGKILMPADGEGRNGVYAAKQGWEVICNDLSMEGKNKALQLATQQKVTIDYRVGDLEKLDFPVESFDCIGLVYAHFSASKIRSLHKKLSSWLKPGGNVIFEAYSKAHFEYRKNNPKAGGPQDLDMLFSVEEVRQDFPDYTFLELREEEIMLKEGVYHNGVSRVVRCFATKHASL